MMKISEIFKVNSNIEIKNLMSDSRQKGEAAMFFCLEGLSNDGHDFIDDAIDNGAICIVHSQELRQKRKDIVYVHADDVKLALNQALLTFYNNCFEKMKIIGITGTDGKTSVAYWLKCLLQEFTSCSYIGDLGVQSGSKNLEDEAIVSDEIALAKYLHPMQQDGVTHCVLELSSVNLELLTPSFLNYEMAILTNFNARHLDFHSTVANYFNAKKQLFDSLHEGKIAIINGDDLVSEAIMIDSVGKKISYGIDEVCDFQAVDIAYQATSCNFNLLHKGLKYPLSSNILGSFYLYNLLAAIAAMEQLGFPLVEVLEKIRTMPTIPGRMEVIDLGQEFNVIVDYAYTPEGFERVLSFVYETKKPKGRLIVVFGAPGKRDSQKRHILGEIADKYADLIILTEEDQRNENPQEIAEQIAQGIKNSDYYFIEERVFAIEQAIAVAQGDDTVVIMAKGNELFNDRGLGKMMYNYLGDAKVAENCLRTLVR